MSEVDKKKTSSTPPHEEYEKGNVHADGASVPELYDPSKESIWTRLGLTAESFKRAPGTTGYEYTSLRLSDRLPLSDDQDFTVARSSPAGTRP